MLACFPAAVFADDAEAYDLWIGKVQVTSENTEGEGWSYSGNGEAGTLTLTNANLTDFASLGDGETTFNIYSRIENFTINFSLS